MSDFSVHNINTTDFWINYISDLSDQVKQSSYPGEITQTLNAIISGEPNNNIEFVPMQDPSSAYAAHLISLDAAEGPNAPTFTAHLTDIDDNAQDRSSVEAYNRAMGVLK